MPKAAAVKNTNSVLLLISLLTGLLGVQYWAPQSAVTRDGSVPLLASAAGRTLTNAASRPPTQLRASSPKNNSFQCLPTRVNAAQKHHGSLLAQSARALSILEPRLTAGSGRSPPDSSLNLNS